MAIFNKYPYTNFHEMNLDWILQELKDLTDKWADFSESFEGVTATAETVPYSEGASVEVSGGVDTPYLFDFKIPSGQNLTVNAIQTRYGVSASSSTPPTSWTESMPTVPAGSYLWIRIITIYSDGHEYTYYIYARQGQDGLGAISTVNGISPDASGNVQIPIPEPSDDIPLSDTSIGFEGISAEYARADHRHLSDPNKLDKQSGTENTQRAYIVDGVSTQSLMKISLTPENGSIARYNANGNLSTDTPLQGISAVNKNYADSTYLSKTDAVADYVQKTQIATTTDTGLVKPDNSTITVDSAGTLSAVASVVKTLVWSNPNPQSGNDGFAAGTYDMDTVDADALFFIISFRNVSTSSSTNGPVYVIPNSGKQLYAQGITSNKLIGRAITINTGNGTFTASAASIWEAYGTATPDNTKMIPEFIWSIK